MITGLVVGFIIGKLLVQSKFRKLEKDQEGLLAEAKLKAAEIKSKALE